MKTRVALLGLIVSGLASLAQASVIYDPAVDWSVDNGNPNDVWSYMTGSGELYTRSGTDTAAPAIGLAWWKKASGDDPNVTYNTTDGELVGWGIHWAPHEIGLGPSGDSNGTMLRWTAPTAGAWAVDALFTGIQDIQNPQGSIYVAHNGLNVFSHYGTTYGSTTSYSGTLTVAAGDTVDFRVTGDLFVRPEITISEVPEPSSLIVVGSGVIGLLAYTWRKRR